MNVQNKPTILTVLTYKYAYEINEVGDMNYFLEVSLKQLLTSALAMEAAIDF